MPLIQTPKNKKKTRHHKIILRFITVLFVCFLLVGYGFWSAVRPLPNLQPTHDFAPAVTSGSPSLTWATTGEQAVGVVGNGVMATHGSQDPLPTASVAKVMVALAVLHEKPLASGSHGPAIPITDDDVAIYQKDLAEGQSTAAVQAGENINEYQALQALLLPSANNIATTLTNWAFGSQDAYLTFANTYAKQLGMVRSTFADASGFSPSTVSTPSDLVLLGEAAMQNNTIATIVNQSWAFVPGVGKIVNVDINVRPAYAATLINGIKTGNTDQAGGCFLYSTPFAGTTAVGVILGSPSLTAALHAAPRVVASLQESLSDNTVIQKGATIGHYKLPWGGPANIVTDSDITFITWKNEHPPVSFAIDTIPSIAENHSIVGSVHATYAGQTKSVQLRSTGMTKPSLVWRFLHP